LKKNSEKIKVNRITNHSSINKGKKEFLLQHFEDVKNLKNVISRDMFDKIQQDTKIDHKFSYPFKLAKYLNSLNQNHLTKNELQKVISSIGSFYEEYLKRVTQNKKLFIQDRVEIKYYKKSSKKFNYRKGQVKSKKIIKKKTLMSNLFNYLKFLDLQMLKDKSFNFDNLILNIQNEIKELEINISAKIKKLNDIDKNKLIKKQNSLKNKLESYQEYNEQLNKIYDNELYFNKMISIISLVQFNVKKNIKLIELTTGSYIKVPVFNKNPSNPKIKPTKHSYVFKDDTNIKLKYWFKFKTPDKVVYIPLSYNHDYHNNFEHFILDKEFYVSLSPKNKININLNVVVNEPIFLIDKKISENKKDFNREKHIVGIDLNIRDNFLVYFNPYENKSIDIDYNRDYINDFIEELSKLDKLSETDKKLDNNKKRLEKLVRINEWYFKKLISKILHKFKEDEIYEIVMEDLDLSKTSASFVKSEEFQIKYSRLIRLLRLGSIKNWFKEQAEKLGIKVHLVNPAYTSQECSKCHFIHKLNRKQDKFHCLNCGHSEHSDFNSPKIIVNRFLEDALRDRLSNFDEYNRTLPNKIKHTTIKNIIHKQYNITSK
jgi:IS605 OrfB family transposase